MSLIYPTIAVDEFADITTELLEKLKVKALFLDVDNTLAVHGSQIPFKGAVKWTKNLIEAGYKILIVSNNFDKRVSPFALQFDLPYLAFAKKPLPSALIRAKNKLDTSLKAHECVIVGDQIFTDVLGANVCNMKSILVNPIGKEKSLVFRVRRKLENRIRGKIKKGEVRHG